MSLLVDHVPINLASGSRVFGPVAIPDTLTSVTARLARCTTATPTLWPNAATTIEIAVTGTVNGGPSALICAAEAPGGIHTLLNGTQAPETLVRAALPVGSNRTVSVTVTVTNGPLVSTVTVESL